MSQSSAKTAYKVEIMTLVVIDQEACFHIRYMPTGQIKNSQSVPVHSGNTDFSDLLEMSQSADMIEAVCTLAVAGIAVAAKVVVAIVVVVDNRSEVECSWAAVAIAVVAEIADFADMGLVAVASFIPLTTLHNKFKCLCSTTQSMIVSNERKTIPDIETLVGQIIAHVIRNVGKCSKEKWPGNTCDPQFARLVKFSQTREIDGSLFLPFMRFPKIAYFILDLLALANRENVLHLGYVT